jgi:effector-binding domain-containing protein
MSDSIPPASGDNELVTLEAMTVAVRRETIQMANIRDFFDGVYGAVAEAVTGQGARLTGPAFAAYRGAPAETVEVAAGFPTDRPIEAVSGVEAFELPGGTAVRHIHRGSYEGLSGAYEDALAWVAERGLAPAELYWEVYVTEPTPDGDPADMVTEIYWPLIPPE